MFRNPVSTKISGSALRKASSVGLLVAGAVGTSPWLRATAACSDQEWSDCAFECGSSLWQIEFCVVGNNGQPYCQCS